jgi:hypothetical protein
MKPLLAALALLIGVAAAPESVEHPPTPPIPGAGWTVTLHDAVDSSALQLACKRVGPKDLLCVDLDWLLDQREKARAQEEEVARRREAQRRAWGCGDNVPDVDCVAGPETRLDL